MENLMRCCFAAPAVLAWAMVIGCAPRATGGGAAVVASADTLQPTGGYRGRYNNDLQGHADFCVRLRAGGAQGAAGTGRVALRYADGSPTGFELDAGVLRPDPRSNGVHCPEAGWARLDARELVPAADGRMMFFHRGGWGFEGNDPASAVHYGHVLAGELDGVGLRYQRSDTTGRPGRWLPAPTAPWQGPGQEAGNGSPCGALEPRGRALVVRSIPGDMKYLNSARTAAIPYAIYGSPAEDLGPSGDRARGIRYSMLTWSWINTRGGGVARALVRDGDVFRRCTDVPAITLAAVADAETRRRTGWVRAEYGAIAAGRGTLLYGWLVTAHRHGAEPVVSHLR